MPNTSSPIAGPHLVRYGIAADQKYLLDELISTYDQIVINGRAVAHMRSALASFLLHRAKNKPYFIDPETHAFQHDPEYWESSSEKSEGEIKRPVRLLAEAYGEPITSRVLGDDRASVIPADLSDDKLRVEFCSRVVDFQAHSISKEAQDEPAAKYFRFRAKADGIEPTSFMPSLLVAPYFYMTANTVSDWLPTNINCVRDSRSRALEHGRPLAAQIAISHDVLDDDAIHRQLADAYKAVGAPDVFLLWVDDFTEQKASEKLLSSMVHLVRTLGEVAPVVNLYGGFFSVALLRSGFLRALIGVTHGLEYGESRALLPVGGGVPVSKFYVPPLHMRLPFRDALRAATALSALASSQSFFSSICDCQECRELIRDKPRDDFAAYGQTRSIPPSTTRRRAIEMPTKGTKDHNVRHYMWCKQKEFSSSQTLSEIIAALRKNHASLINTVGPDFASHCKAWADVLAGVTN